MSKSIINLLGLAIALAIAGGTSIYWAYFARILYQWFILVNFPGLPELSIWQITGIRFFLSLVLPNKMRSIKDEKIEWTAIFLHPPVILLFAWVVKSIWLT